MISIHFHCLFGRVGNAGGTKIIKNIMISIHFHCLFGGVGNVGSSGIIENTIISSIVIACLVGWETQADPESFKI